MRDLIGISLCIMMLLGMTFCLYADNANSSLPDSLAKDNLLPTNKDSLSVYQIAVKKAKAANEPLLNKNIGLEFNFFRIMASPEDLGLSGTLSVFNLDRTAEIAFPVYYYNYDKYSSYQHYLIKRITEFSIDAQYRKFYHEHQNGLYFSLFSRYTYLKGYKGDEYYMQETEPIKDTEHKLGIGFGFGYRRFWYSGLYWGCNFSFGRYVTGKNNEYFRKLGDQIYINSRKAILDVDFLKVGYAF